jgi:hypothetical protein
MQVLEGRVKGLGNMLKMKEERVETLESALKESRYVPNLLLVCT